MNKSMHYIASHFVYYLSKSFLSKAHHHRKFDCSSQSLSQANPRKAKFVDTSFARDHHRARPAVCWISVKRDFLYEFLWLFELQSISSHSSRNVEVFQQVSRQSERRKNTNLANATVINRTFIRIIQEILLCFEGKPCCLRLQSQKIVI